MLCVSRRTIAAARTPAHARWRWPAMQLHAVLPGPRCALRKVAALLCSGDVAGGAHPDGRPAALAAPYPETRSLRRPRPSHTVGGVSPESLPQRRPLVFPRSQRAATAPHHGCPRAAAAVARGGAGEVAAGRVQGCKAGGILHAESAGARKAAVRAALATLVALLHAAAARPGYRSQRRQPSLKAVSVRRL